MRLTQFLLFSLFGTIFIADAKYLSGLGPVTRLIDIVPDLLSGIIFLAVIIFFSINKRLDIPVKYLIIGFFITLHLFVGALINSVQPGAIFSGIRVYFKYIPLFLLPMVLVFTSRDVMRYIKFVLGLSVIQMPIALYQRFVEFKFSDFASGDVVRGTLTSSGILSIYLICAIAVLTAFYLRKRISHIKYAILLFILFIPTTINETKSTLILLPIALFMPVLLDTTRGQIERLRMFIPTALIGLVLIGVFAAIYNQHWAKGGTNILYFLTKGEAIDMLYKGQVRGKGYDTARIDSIVLALKGLSDDPVHVAVGLGMGNVATSFSKVLGGEYEEYSDYGVRVTTISYLLWETGIIGVLLVYVFLYQLYKDVRYFKDDRDFIGVLSLGWCVVTVILSISMFYKTLLDQNTISYLFWFISGHIVAESTRCRVAALHNQQSNISPSGLST